MVKMVEEVDEAEKIEIVEKPGPSGTAERPVTPDDIKKRRKRRRGLHHKEKESETTAIRWNPASLNLRKNQLWYIFVENVTMIMRYVPRIQFGAENVDIELCIKSALKDLLYLMHVKQTRNK
ncbi:DNA-directed RNA polymerases I, II, and III subunit RPABC4 [Camponotus japonicus]